MSNPEMVTIPLAQYLEMLEQIEWLQALEAAGVDNWDGYDQAREILEEDKYA